jgi:hypothetical protein
MHSRQALKFLGIGIALLLLTYQLGDVIIKALIPLYQWAIKLIDYRFDMTTVSISKMQGENFLQLEVVLSQPFWLGAQQIAPTQPIYNSAAMPLGYALQPFIIILTMILAWPAKHFITILYRFIIGMPLIMIVMILDMPIQLVNSTWQSFEKTLQLNIATTSWPDLWSDFLNGGGLIALSIACGLLAVGLAQWRPRHESNV